MRFPGFTADESLFRSKSSYGLVGAVETLDAQVHPSACRVDIYPCISYADGTVGFCQRTVCDGGGGGPTPRPRPTVLPPDVISI